MIGGEFVALGQEVDFRLQRFEAFFGAAPGVPLDLRSLRIQLALVLGVIKVADSPAHLRFANV